MNAILADTMPSCHPSFNLAQIVSDDFTIFQVRHKPSEHIVPFVAISLIWNMLLPLGKI